MGYQVELNTVKQVELLEGYMRKHSWILYGISKNLGLPGISIISIAWKEEESSPFNANYPWV